MHIKKVSAPKNLLPVLISVLSELLTSFVSGNLRSAIPSIYFN